MKKLLIIIAIFFIHTSVVLATEVSILAPANKSVGESFTVSVSLDTGGKVINSFDITLAYPKDKVSFGGYKEGNSIKKLWLVQPKEQVDGIHFSGIIPGGVDGLYDPDKTTLQPIPIIELVFSAKTSGDASFKILHSEVLENDGRGTKLAHEVKNANVTISDGGNVDKENKDLEPPQAFDISYIEAGLFSQTPSMIIFSTTDNESGIEKYQLRSSRNEWSDVVSPLQIRKALLTRDVIVRAVDFNGNIREATATIPGIISGNQLFGIIIAGVICYLLFFVVKRRR